ncbi:MAG: hypothetical protein GY927_16240 [bacterium]|nr:hypothetical protein [bacterium]
MKKLIWLAGIVMGQLGFFDRSKRYAGLDKFGDPLVLLKIKVPFENFRADLKAIWRIPKERRKSNAGRSPWDEVLMFNVLVGIERAGVRIGMMNLVCNMKRLIAFERGMLRRVECFGTSSVCSVRAKSGQPDWNP